MQKELKRIESEAYRTSVEVRGKADARAAAIYAGAYGKDPEFYRFIRSLESYRKAMRENARMVISTDSDFYRYLQKAR
jgi:membrane protease subunit HflC